MESTASGTNIVITPEMKEKAEEIVGNETNPYLQARMIYWYIVTTLPYSHAPHIYLEAARHPRIHLRPRDRHRRLREPEHVFCCTLPLARHPGPGRQRVSAASGPRRNPLLGGVPIFRGTAGSR